MKIDNSRIFKADLYEVTRLENYGSFKNEELENSFGYVYYTEKLSMKNAIVIEFGKGFYVPVGYLDNIVKYFDVASHISKNGSLHNPDKRFTTLRINKFNCQKS